MGAVAQHKLGPLRRWRIAAMVLVFSAVVVVGFPLIAKSDDGNFASLPDFKRHFEHHPPSARLPSEEQKNMLERFKPRVFLARDQQAPIDFYADYIAAGRLYAGGELLSEKVTQAQLNSIKDRSDSEFIYSGALPLQGTATVYGRYDTDTLQYRGQSWALEFLSYNLVFPSSGLVAELSALAKFGLGLLANLDDWHQLDHYVGVTIAIYQKKPVAFFLQQHNYQTSYLISNLQDWPEDNRVAVDVALRSNELYPHSVQRRRHPAVSFVSETNISFIKSGRKKPMLAGWDITHGQKELRYTLRHLAPNDAFYQFKGRLGKSRTLPGRDGPPGADYVTLPGLMRLSHRLVAGFRPGTVEREREKIATLIDRENFRIRPTAIDTYKVDFIQAWQYSQ